jgi:DNA helicase II / ATP-dependent DNA helicase PcrA
VSRVYASAYQDDGIVVDDKADAQVSRERAPARVWSPYQEAIFDFAANGQGNAVVKAVAGSGKTTTMVEAMRRVTGKSQIFLAFNKSIAEELKQRGVNARTFHSLTYSPVTQARKCRDVSTDKVRNLIDETMCDRDAKLYGAFVSKLVGLGKNAGIGCLVPDSPASWVELAEHHDLDLDHEDADYQTAIQWASSILTASNHDGRLDFDDLLYLAVKDGISLPKSDFVVVDEYQDTNDIQIAVIRKIMKPTSRIMVVGDPAQAIYGFRGASTDSMDKAIVEFSAKELPLTVSYRCPKSVVEHAHQWVSHIEHHADAPQGKVLNLAQEWTSKTFKANDLIVCRTTAPLMGTAYQLLKDRVPCKILGRDIGQGLKSLVKKMNSNGIDNLVERIYTWKRREMEKAIAKKQEAKSESIRDKADCLLFLIRTLKETKRNVPGLYEVIDTLFADKANAVVLSTIHKAKGLEANRVYWLNHHKCPAMWAKQDWQRDQERNLCYVATTRAKSELILIEEKSDASPDEQ